MEDKPEFTGIRAYLWPIHRFELKKFLPIAFIMFCVLFNYTVLRDTKDTLVVNAGGGAMIPFLKFSAVTPAAVLFVLIYTKLANIFDNEKLFYIIISPFLIFFGLFAFLIYPNLEFFHPSIEGVKAMQNTYPAFQSFFDMYAYWSFSLFYILSELWGSSMIALMFWQFANRVVKNNETKRFYGLIGVIGNTSLLFAGEAIKFSSTGIKQYVQGDAWPLSIKIICTLVIIIGIIAMLLYRWMHTNVLNDPKYYDPTEEKKQSKKPKLTMKESFKVILSSPVLGFIALLIIGYGITINLIEVQWKDQMRIYFAGDKGAYNAFMGWQSQFIGFFTIFFGWFIGANLLRRLPWILSALITPSIIFILGGIFFFFILGRDAQILSALNPIAASVFVGLSAVVMSKSVKYTLFDTTKEMAYRPLDPELKSKGKAAVELIAGRGGKAGGAGIQAILLMLFVTKDLLIIIPYSFTIFAIICVAWLFSVSGLNVRMKKIKAYQ